MNPISSLKLVVPALFVIVAFQNCSPAFQSDISQEMLEDDVSLASSDKSVNSDEQMELTATSPLKEAVYTAKITGYYKSIFNRAPDAAGLKFYVDQALSGVPFSKIHQTLLASNEAFVVQTIRKELRREVKPNEVGAYVKALDKGLTTRQAFQIQMNLKCINQSEGECPSVVSRTVATKEVKALFESILDRKTVGELSEAGVFWWIDRRMEGRSLASISSALKASDEYFVRSVIKQAFNRSASMSEVSRWVSMLEKKTLTRDQVKKLIIAAK